MLLQQLYFPSFILIFNSIVFAYGNVDGMCGIPRMFVNSFVGITIPLIVLCGLSFSYCSHREIQHESQSARDA
jgi:uncharacterized membrane protein YhdT